MPLPAFVAGGARDRPALELAELLRDHLDAILRAPLSSGQHAVVRALLRCRTACGFARPSYNSCRDRHCPKCQGSAQARWVRARMQRVLRTHHFHVVFTLPAQLRPRARLPSTRALHCHWRRARTRWQPLGDRTTRAPCPVYSLLIMRNRVASTLIRSRGRRGGAPPCEPAPR